MASSEHKHTQHEAHRTDDKMQSHPVDHAMHNGHAGYDMPEHPLPGMNMEHASHQSAGAHAGHDEHANHADHTGHEQMFRSRFWGGLVLSLPVLIFSAMIQEWLGFKLSHWIYEPENRDEAVSILEKNMESSRLFAEKTYDYVIRKIKGITPGCQISPQEMEKLTGLLVDAGLLPKGTPFSEVVDLSFLSRIK